jgi:serine/threonine protein phosphatase 1
MMDLKKFFRPMLAPRERMAFRTPEGMRLYAVGDVHGRLDLLDEMLGAIAADAEGDCRRNAIVFLGDYVDRGPDSKGVVDRLVALDWPGWEIVFLRGNHDQAVVDFLADAEFYRAWRGVGAPETLLSYGVMPPRFDKAEAFEAVRVAFADALPPAHRNFFDNLAYRYEAGDYYFAHAGVRPGLPLDRQVPEDLLWIREDFLLSNIRLEKIVVHGHTPQERAERRGYRIGVDTGAYATGVLSAAVLDGADVRFLSVHMA